MIRRSRQIALGATVVVSIAFVSLMVISLRGSVFINFRRIVGYDSLRLVTISTWRGSFCVSNEHFYSPGADHLRDWPFGVGMCLRTRDLSAAYRGIEPRTSSCGTLALQLV